MPNHRVLILGIDGYIGYPLALHLIKQNFEVCGVDNLSRRDRVRHIGGASLTNIASFDDRANYLSSFNNFIDNMSRIDVDYYDTISAAIKYFKPDTIVHLAQMPSAPWSMINAYHAYQTQHENCMANLNVLWAMKQHCPNAHLLKLGTMGEYGTPNCDIPEGEIPKECLTGGVGPYVGGYDAGCPMSGLIFPRQPGSFYHLSKVFDTYNVDFACRNWGLRSTDVMQGVVYGLNKPNNNIEITRFDYDEYFGTAINRFCTQAIIEYPITVYGNGNQTRGYLPLKDSIQCLTLAIENPPEDGECRTFNQFEEIYSINELADIVNRQAQKLGLNPGITHISNPRKEKESHYYNPEHSKLLDLGYKPTDDLEGEVGILLQQLMPYKDRVNKKVIMPKTKWE
jgi:nucleoside-diphosphate-sugar epimerase